MLKIINTLHTVSAPKMRSVINAHKNAKTGAVMMKNVSDQGPTIQFCLRLIAASLGTVIEANDLPPTALLLRSNALGA